jgi:carbamoyltransferase
MIILGINAYHADASAAIFADGKLVAAIEEERFTRIKHWAGFPDQAIAFCLQEAGIGYTDVDYYAIGRDPLAKLGKKLMFLAKNPGSSFTVVKERFNNSKKVTTIDAELSRLSGLSANQFSGKIKRVEHHRSHIASAFFASPFEKAACLTIDGSGDFTTAMTAIGAGNTITVLDSVDFPHSIGIFYTAFTQLLGFPYYGDEYKIMGLAAYGEPKYTHRLADVVKLTDDGLFKLNLSYFKTATSGIISYDEKHAPVVAPLYSKKIIEQFGAARKKDEPLNQYHKDLAASVQVFTETIIFHLLNSLHQKTGLDNICIAGGVAQNSVANGRILQQTPFKNIYIPCACHDAGISMGAALYTQHIGAGMGRQPAIRSAYTGSSFSNEAIKKILDENNMSYIEMPDENLFDHVVDCIVSGGVVGWFSGRAEFGPRALGGRSILADPRNADAGALLNLKIKRRESFRPFAPSILKEYRSEYFESDDEVPFMEKVFCVKKEKQSVIPAVTHVDGTGRLQTVDEKISPRYYRLIEAFRKKTGIPILLNTSFNENEPIVNDPREAIACFVRTNMDMLVMENIVLEK